MTRETLCARLDALSEPDYRRFAAALIPTLAPSAMRGVRLPALRKLARELSRGDWRANLRCASDDSFEEILLQGMVIGLADAPPDEIFSLVADFIPKIDNWSVCDSFCASFKLAKSQPNAVWDFILPYLSDEREYFARFGVVMLLFYYVDAAHIDAVLALLGAVRAQGCYAKKAVAWAVSICYGSFPAHTARLLAADTLDPFTRGLAFRKIAESHAVSAADRSAARALAEKRPLSSGLT